MTKRTDLNGILAALRESASVLVCSHVSPDGDSVGSAIACCRLLRALGVPRVDCVQPDPVPERYDWIPGAESVLAPSQVCDRYETLLIVDVAQVKRIGGVANLIHEDMNIVVLDHHLEEDPYGDIVHLDPTASATGELVVDLYEAAGMPIDTDAATAMYVAITTDTGGFRFANTTARTHRHTATLVDKGIDVSEISRRVFDLTPLSKFRLMVRVLDRARFLAAGRIAFSELSEADLDELHATGEDMEGLINFMRNVVGVEVAVLFREFDNDVTKFSVRSTNGLNAAEFCKPFGGGGHVAAAGATVEEPLKEVRPRVLDRLCALLESHG